MNRCILVFLLILVQSCTIKREPTIKINTIVDYYISFYGSQNPNFNPKEKYILVGMNRENNDYLFYIYDKCFECEGRIPEHSVVKEYKGYKIILYTDTEESMSYLLQNFIGLRDTKAFSVKSHQENIMYDSGRLWRIFYNNKGIPIFLCSSNQSELETIKRKLGFSRNIEECRR